MSSKRRNRVWRACVQRRAKVDCTRRPIQRCADRVRAEIRNRRQLWIAIAKRNWSANDRRREITANIICSSATTDLCRVRLDSDRIANRAERQRRTAIAIGRVRGRIRAARAAVFNGRRRRRGFRTNGDRRAEADRRRFALIRPNGPKSDSKRSNSRKRFKSLAKRAVRRRFEHRGRCRPSTIAQNESAIAVKAG